MTTMRELLIILSGIEVIVENMVSVTNAADDELKEGELKAYGGYLTNDLSVTSDDDRSVETKDKGDEEVDRDAEHRVANSKPKRR